MNSLMKYYFLVLVSPILVFSQNLSFSGGTDHSISLCADGHVYTAGSNSNGASGLGNFTSPTLQYSKVLVGAGPNDGSGFLYGIKQVDAGSGGHNIALACAGNVYTWGLNGNGQLGINNNTNQNVPQKVLTGEQGDASGFLTGVVYVSGGNSESYAILSTGELMSWGGNDNGQLGSNPAGTKPWADSWTPVYVRKCDGTTLKNVIQVDAGDDFGVALLSDGTVWTWGANQTSHRSLGIGNPGPSESKCAQQVLGAGGVGFLTNITKITAGDSHVLALADDATIWGWGGDWAHQLAVTNNPGASDIYFPAKVLSTSTGPNFSGVIDISAGNNFSIALKSDGTVWTWGESAGTSAGQLGRAVADYPGQVTGLSNIIGVSEGDWWSFAVNSSGQIYEWGQNSANGFLGLNTTTASYSTPQLVTTLPCTAGLPCPDASLPGNISVCTSTSVNLFAGSLGSTFTYKWKVNGSTIPGATSANYTALGTGTYRVIISDATLRGCGACPADSDQVVISSTSNTTALPPTYCSLPANLNFCVSGASGSNYDWYSTSTGGAKLNGAASNCYATTVNSAPAVYYAQDLATYKYYAGYSFGNAVFGASSSSDYYTNATIHQYFDVLSPMILDTVTVRVTGGAGGAWSFTVAVRDNTNAIVGSVVVNTSGSGTMTLVVPLGASGISLPVGTNYYLDISASSSSPNFYVYHAATTTTVYPNGVTGVMSLKDPQLGAYAAQYYGAFYDIKLRAGNTCARTPVQAIYDCTLPVEFGTLVAEKVATGVLIDWTTLFEEHADYFAIRRSYDGIKFETIGLVSAAGNSTNPVSYRYFDNEVESYPVYYQLQEVDVDGTLFQSEIVQVENSSEEILVYPNPSDHTFSIQISNAASISMMELTDATGRIIFHETTTFNKQFGSDLPKGMYFLTVMTDQTTSVKKLIKE